MSTQALFEKVSLSPRKNEKIYRYLYQGHDKATRGDITQPYSIAGQTEA